MLVTPEYVFKDVTRITPTFLAQMGIRALVLDVDNTLTEDRSQELSPEVAQWLEQMRAADIRMTIVSNGTGKRVGPFAQKLGMEFISLSAKPLPLGLMRARRRLGVKRSQMAMVGDQLFADRMAAALYGIPAFVVIARGPDPGCQRAAEAPLGEKILEKVLRPRGTGPLSSTEIRFGTAGQSESFAAQGYKSSLDVPAYTAAMGLNAFEYQCGRGVRLGLDKATKMAALAKEKDVLFSVHAPYYISMSSLEEDKRLASIDYLLQSCAVCRALGGRRVIFHSGSCGKQSREAALEKAQDTLRRALEALDQAGYQDMTLCPETMGKIGQLGTLEEVLALCSLDERVVPCIDFGHLNARTLGGIASKADYAAILDRMEQSLGDERARRFHVHFSRIEYSAGRKTPLDLCTDPVWPGTAAFDGAVCRAALAPVVICESAGTQAEDAKTMQQMYFAAAART